MTRRCSAPSAAACGHNGAAHASGVPRTATTDRRVSIPRAGVPPRSAVSERPASFTSCQRRSTTIIPPSIPPVSGPVADGRTGPASGGGAASRSVARAPSSRTKAWIVSVLTRTPTIRPSHSARAVSYGSTTPANVARACSAGVKPSASTPHSRRTGHVPR